MNRIAIGLAAALAAIAPAVAEDTAPKQITLDLNALQDVAGACRVTFVATNDMGSAIDKASLELAIFGKDGAITRMVLLDFKGLTPGKTKVVQFDLKDIGCGNVSRVLINDLTACDGQGVDAAACLAALKPSTATGISFGL